ncbi:Lipocalin-like domain-containing protein [Aspergillus pseudoustus]|uniref:Lipocalin-like domain-containing protein n=1 Tax=Aspergillus pseudoustus TaxID=1810923 RepID=A0ABR4IEF8_9EURO
MSSQPHPITGTWALQTFGLYLPDTTPTPDTPALLHPLGNAPLGRITFTADGYMSCTLTSRDAAAPIESASWVVASDEEVVSAARAMTTYCGPFRLYKDSDNDNGQALLATAVDIALDPNWMGKPQVRRWELRDGEKTLVLRPVQDIVLPDGTKTTAVLVWHRLDGVKASANL